MVDFNDKDWHDRPDLSSERAPQQDKTVTLKKKTLVKCPRFGLNTKTYRLTDRQSQCDSDFDFDFGFDFDFDIDFDHLHNKWQVIIQNVHFMSTLYCIISWIRLCFNIK
jgi:hypothetical protein